MGQDKTLKHLAASSPENPESDGTHEFIEIGENDCALLGVVDGVGHGPEAASIANRVLNCLRAHSELDLVSLVQECHRAVAHSRGAVIGLALLCLPKFQIQFVGVGDVTMRIVTQDASQGHGGTHPTCEPASPSEVAVRAFVNNNGTLGYRIPERLRTSSCGFAAGDVLLLSSDGIGQDFGRTQFEQVDALEAETIAASVVSTFGSARDDATLVVAR